MFQFDYIRKEDIKDHNTKWTEIPDHSYRIIGCSGSGRTNVLLNLIIMNHVLIKIIYILKIHTKQNIN